MAVEMKPKTFHSVRFAKPVLPGFVILFNRLDLPNLYYLDRPYKQICGRKETEFISNAR
jgi:hypothetical protein